MMPIARYPRHADDFSFCLDHSICDRVHIGRPEDFPVPLREPAPAAEVTCEGGITLQTVGATDAVRS
jgi:hypothetical protein